MYTRQQYLAHECTHEQYYGQFVSTRIKNVVIQRIGIARIKSALQEDGHLNNISLATWDSFHPTVSVREVHDKMKEAGDFLTAAGIVCIAKQAAKEAATETP